MLTACGLGLRFADAAQVGERGREQVEVQGYPGADPDAASG